MAVTSAQDGDRAISPPSRSYVRWEEVHVSGDNGRRVVHYYLKDALGRSVLAVIGREKSVRHMSYDVCSIFQNHHLSAIAALPLSSCDIPVKLRSRREVVDWLSSIVSDSLSYVPPGVLNRFLENEDGADVSGSKALSSWKMRHHSKDFLWLGLGWTCRKRRKHYRSFSLNGITIAVHDFVYVTGEDNKRLIAYVEDLYEDMKSNNMVSVRWFHKADEVGIALPTDTDEREIFFTLCLQDLSVECIDGLATVLSSKHFEKYLDEAADVTPEPYLCRRKIDNDDVKPFDITQVQGYWNQQFLRYMHTLSTRIFWKSKSSGSNLDESGNGTGFTHKSISINSKGTGGDETGHLALSNRVDGQAFCIPGKEEFNKQFQQQLSAGCEVEVLCQDSGIRGCWFRCIILKRCQDRVKVQYKDIHDSDGIGHLKEWFLLSKVAKSDTLAIRLRGRKVIRPHPSPRSKVLSCFNVGSVVDAWWHDGWWEGLVICRESEHEIHVFFPGESQTAVFNQGELRHSLEWMHGKWIHMKERPDLVSLLQTNRELQKIGEGSDYYIPTQASPLCRNQGHRPWTDCKYFEGRFALGKLDSIDEYPEEKGTKEKYEEFAGAPACYISWGSSRKRSRSFISKSRFTFKKRCNDRCDSRNGEEDPSVHLQFSLTKAIATDLDNCKPGGDALFNPLLAMSNMVMTR